MFDKYGSAINTIASIVIAITGVLTLAMIIVAGVFWLGELNSDVEQNQQELKEVREELKDLRNEFRQEIADTRQEILAAIEDINKEIETSNQQILDALANHTHNEDGHAIFTRPVAE